MIRSNKVLAAAEAAVSDEPPVNFMDKFLKQLPPAIDEKPPKQVDAPPNPDATTGNVSQADTVNRPDPAKPAAQPAVGGDAAGGARKPDGQPPKPLDGGKAPDGKPDDLDTLPAPKTAKDWDKAKEKFREKQAQLAADLKAREEKIGTLEARVVELEAISTKTPDPSPEVEALKKQIDELNQALIVTEVTAHPKFKAHYQGRIDAAITKAKTLAGPDKADAIEKLIKLPDSEYKKAQIEEFLADIDSDYTKNRLISVFDTFDAIEAERQQDIKDADKTREKFQIESTEKQKARIKANQEIVDRAIKAASDPEKGWVYFQKQAGNDAWNKEVDARIGAFKEVLLTPEKLSQEEAGKAAMYAVSFLPLARQYAALNKEHGEMKAKYEAQIAALKGAQPGSGNTTQPAAGETTNRDKSWKIKELTPDERLKRWSSGMAEEARA